MNRYIQYVLGMGILTLGLSLVIMVNIGASPWDTANIGVAETFGVSVAMGNLINSFFLLIVAAIIRKEYFVWRNVKVFLVAFIFSIFFYLWLDTGILLFLTNIDGLVIKIIIAFFGLIIAAIGVVMYVKTELPPNPIDNMMVTLADYTRLSFGGAKIVTDCIGLTIGFLFAGPIGAFTIVVLFSLGTFVGFFETLYNKIYKIEKEV